jgi:hypothetical protein
VLFSESCFELKHEDCVERDSIELVLPFFKGTNFSSLIYSECFLEGTTASFFEVALFFISNSSGLISVSIESLLSDALVVIELDLLLLSLLFFPFDDPICSEYL